MATTIVRKGQNRKAAEAKRARAAQKTPLPGDAVITQVQDALSDNLDTFGMPELRQLAKAKGITVPFGVKKAALVALLRGEPTEPTEPTETIPSEGPIKRGTPANKKVPQFDPKASAEKDATDAKAAKPEVDAKTGKAIGARVLELRKEYTRGVVAAAAGTTPSVVWRWEQGRPKPSEMPAIEALFAKVERGEVTKPERKVFGKPASGPTKADLTRCLEQVTHVLSEAPATGAKVAQLRATINTALDLIDDIRKAEANA